MRGVAADCRRDSVGQWPHTRAFHTVAQMYDPYVGCAVEVEVGHGSCFDMVFYAAYFASNFDGVDGHVLPCAAVLADADAEIGVEGGHAFACGICDYCGRSL